MRYLNDIAAKLTSPQMLWIIILLCLVAAALAAGAPDGGWCPGTSC